MARISERISSAVATVTCPGCEQRVVPVTKAAPGSSSPAESSGSAKRWSFIWRPPSGPVCPECFFPLERLTRRLKWVHTASIGLVLLILGALVTFVRLAGNQGEWMGALARMILSVGAVALIVGAVGVVVGGRSRGASSQP